jgi:hypothetical protein
VVARFADSSSWALAPLAATIAYLGGTAINEARELAAAEHRNR